jgi:2-methylcitrate dehydratase PrpD
MGGAGNNTRECVAMNRPTAQRQASEQDTEAQDRDFAESLAAFAADLTLDAIPEEVRRRAKLHILDAAGIALASTRFEFAQTTLAAVQDLADPGPVAVIGMPARLPCRDAALVNAVLCHGLDYDDTHLASVVHPTAGALAAAFSTAVHRGASGADLLTAYILGVEAANRVGAVAHGRFLDLGFNPTATVTGFGAALAAGRILGLGARELTMAQGIMLDITAPGSLAFLADGAWTKRMVPGWAAVAGMTAAFLARRGFVGPNDPYVGRYGLYRLLLGPGAAQCDIGRATDGLGQRWELLETSIKPFPACHFVHAALDAAMAIRTRLEGRVEDIAEVRVLVPGEVVDTVCEPLGRKRRPKNTYEAQFSLPYLVAAALAGGRVTLNEIDERALDNPAILAFADRIGYEVDPASPYPRYYSGEVVATLSDGRVLRQREEINRGSPERPLSEADITEKFMANARTAVSKARAERVKDVILSLERIDDVARLNDVLTDAGGQSGGTSIQIS